MRPGAAPPPQGPREVRCTHCGALAQLHPSSASFYNGQDYGPVWACAPCSALVGCHKGTTNALGSPADKATRQLRRRAHALFDPLWEAKVRLTGCSRKKARGAAYRWLAEQLGVPPSACHISWMGPEQVQRVIALCLGVREAALVRRAAASDSPPPTSLPSPPSSLESS